MFVCLSFKVHLFYLRQVSKTVLSKVILIDLIRMDVIQYFADFSPIRAYIHLRAVSIPVILEAAKYST